MGFVKEKSLPQYGSEAVGCLLAVVFTLTGFDFGRAQISQSIPTRQIQSHHVPDTIAKLKLQPLSPLAASKRLDLAITLPWRNTRTLTNLLKELYDPSSANFHHYLTPEQFTAQFGPTEADYEAVVAFAKAHGLAVTRRHSNRMLVDVSGPVSAVEEALHLKLFTYRHPTEAREFYAPDSEPTVDLSVPLLHIGGLENYELARPLFHVKRDSTFEANAQPETGSATNGGYIGDDFRAAYVPGVSLTGTGQTVGLLEFDGFYTNDIVTYESQAGLTNVPLQTVLCDSFDGTPGGNNVEVALDIDMAISIAPGLTQVIVYEAANGAPPEDVLNRMATDNLAAQLSSSWQWFSFNPATDQIYQEFAAQGQSMFQASGDSDAFANIVTPPAGDPFLTVVGGTTLTTTGPDGAWVSEIVWNRGNDDFGYVGSGGGIATNYAIPFWQQGIDMSGNQGSTTSRNLPDVALTAENVYVVANNGQGISVGGTSCAAPLWAGFAALLNQQTAASGLPPVGFLNPVLYALGMGTNYNSDFHDITVGNNTNNFSHGRFISAVGYDLCTGWGTPNGQSMIDALAQISPGEPSIVTQPQDQTVSFTSTASFYVAVAGSPPFQFQWAWNGTNISGATNFGLILTNIQLAQAGLYSVEVSNSLGSTVSSNALLTVIPPVAPTITNQPSNQNASLGGTAIFEAVATGTLPLSYQWTFNGTNLVDATNASLTLTNIQLAAAGQYALQVTNAGGNTTSSNAALTIYPGWTSLGAPSNSWSSIASSADGTKLVAVGGGGIYTSTNSGSNWRPATVPDDNWTCVASSADGSKLAATANRGWVYTSTNSGITWARSGSVSNRWQAIAASADGTKLVAGISGGGIFNMFNVSGLIYVSTNSGSSWINVWTNTGLGTPRPDWSSVASSTDGVRLVATSSGNISLGQSAAATVWFISPRIPGSPGRPAVRRPIAGPQPLLQRMVTFWWPPVPERKALFIFRQMPEQPGRRPALPAITGARLRLHWTERSSPPRQAMVSFSFQPTRETRGRTPARQRTTGCRWLLQPMAINSLPWRETASNPTRFLPGKPSRRWGSRLSPIRCSSPGRVCGRAPRYRRIPI